MGLHLKTSILLILAGLCLVAAANLSPVKISPLLNQEHDQEHDQELTGKAGIFKRPIIPKPIRPGNLIHRVIKRIIAAIVHLFRKILHRLQNWVLHTTNHLELLEARQVLGPFFNRVLHRVIVWLKKFAHYENECIGRVLCEMSDQASGYLPSSLKQVLLIYFSSNQEANLYYQPLANGFISQSSCARLYTQCDQRAFLSQLENINVTVPEFFDDNELHQTVSELGKPVAVVPVVPVGEPLVPVVIGKASEPVPTFIAEATVPIAA